MFLYFYLTCLHNPWEIGGKRKALIFYHFRRLFIFHSYFTKFTLLFQVSLVINYDLPNNRELYIHRIGRSGRFGRKVFLLPCDLIMWWNLCFQLSFPFFYHAYNFQRFLRSHSHLKLGMDTVCWIKDLIHLKTQMLLQVYKKLFCIFLIHLWILLFA